MKPLVRRLLLLSALILVAGITLLFRLVLVEEVKPEKEVEIDKQLPVFYEFGAGLCKPCRLMEPIIHELEAKYKGKINFVKINTNLEKNKPIKDQFKITLIPVQVILDVEGNEIHRHNGFWSFEDIEKELVRLKLITEEELALLENPPVEEEQTGLAAKFFNNLERWIQSNYWIGLLAVFAWGVISVIFSPCQLSTIPLVVGYVGGYSEGGAKKAFWYSSSFVFGLFIPIFVFALVLTEALTLLEHVGTYFFGVLLVLMGLYLMEILILSFKAPGAQSEKKGAIGAFVLGIVYSIFVTGPCTLAFMSPIIGVSSAGDDRMYGYTLIFVYSIAHCLPILAAGTATGWVQKLLGSTTMGKTTNIFRWVSGLIILLVGVYFLALK